MKKWVIIIIVVAVVAGGVFLIGRFRSQQNAAAQGAYQTEPLQRGELTATVGAKAPSSLGTDALLDFRMEVTLDGQKLTQAEVGLLESRVEVELARAALERSMGTLGASP